MRHDERERPVVRLDRVEEAAPVDVREVDEDAPGVELADVVLAGRRESAVAHRGGARDAEARVVEVDERDADDEPVGDAIERTRGVERAPSLDADEGRVLPLGPGAQVLARVPHDGHVLLARGEPRAKVGDVADEGLGAALGRAKRVGRDDPDGAGDLRLAHARQVDVTVEARAEHPRAVPLGEVVAVLARPEVRVDVQIDDVAREVEVDGRAGDAEVLGPGGRVLAVVTEGERHLKPGG